MKLRLLNGDIVNASRYRTIRREAHRVAGTHGPHWEKELLLLFDGPDPAQGCRQAEAAMEAIHEAFQSKASYLDLRAVKQQVEAQFTEPVASVRARLAPEGEGR